MITPPAPSVPSTIGLTPPPRWRVWLQAVRVFSFPASVVPIVVAAALSFAAGSFEPVLIGAMLVASVACHAGANLANDYFDHVQGVDTADSLGPSKVIQQGLLSPVEVRRGMVTAFGLATIFGVGIVAVSGWPIFVLALLCLGAAFFYTGGPRPLGYIALGELTVALSMGYGMVLGAVYVLTGRMTGADLLAATAVASLVAAILHANNLRDLEADRRAGKITLATKLGMRNGAREFAVLVAGAFLAALAMIAVNPRWWPVCLVLLCLPRAFGLIRLGFTAQTSLALNPLVRGTALLHLRFGLLLAAGIFVAMAFER